MNSLTALGFAVLLAVGGFAVAVEPTPGPASTTGYAVALRRGPATVPAAAAQRTLGDKAVELVESSNFNSRAPLWDWNISDLLEGYRKTVAGDFLLVTFDTPRVIKTVGGDVRVREIVIGLGGAAYAGPLFTIDDELRLVGHTKYSGLLCVEFLKLAKRASEGG